MSLATEATHCIHCVLVLRKPELLILDEATANIDTVTEQLAGQHIKETSGIHHPCYYSSSIKHNRKC